MDVDSFVDLFFIVMSSINSEKCALSELVNGKRFIWADWVGPDCFFTSVSASPNR